MPSPFGPMQIIVNPRAGRGAVEQSWQAVRDVIEREDLAYDVAFTEAPGHATEIARAAVLAERRFVVAVGGDGTVHEVVNGMMGDDEPLDPDAVLGVVAAGSGGDFVRTFGLSRDPAGSARHLAGKTLWGRLDVGRVRYRAFDGRESARWFVNIAEVGIGAQVVAAVRRMPRVLGSRAYRLGALRGILGYRPRDATVAIHGRRARGSRRDAPLEETTWAGTVTMLVVANCQFFGGGLRVAPRAIPSDQLLDMLIGHGSKWEAIRALRRMPRGEHVPDDTIAEYLTDRVHVEADEPLLVEADGELLGTTPASFDLAASALSLKI